MAVRELSRLLIRIAVAVFVASLIAEVRALDTGGDFFRTWKVMLLLLGCLMLLLAAGGSRTGGTAGRLNWGVILPGLPLPVYGRAEGPQLTAAAVFVGSGLALIALGVFA